VSTPPAPSKGIARWIPGLALFRGVTSTLLRTELIVAITVFAVLVPSAMAYGDLAGVTPVAGLYVALAAMVMYALFGPPGRSSWARGDGRHHDRRRGRAAGWRDAARYASLAALLALLVGAVSILARIARLGFITDFLSKPSWSVTSLAPP